MVELDRFLAYFKVKLAGMSVFLLILFGYLSGSIPFGWLVGRIYNIDIQKQGSGNIGATNVYRTIGPIAGWSVFILDMLKGSLPVLAALIATKDPLITVLTGLAAVLGHLFPVFLKFKGGRGSAVGLGILIVIAPDIFIITMLLVVAIIALSRYVSLASISGAVFVSLLMALWHKPLPYLAAAIIIAVFILVKHIPNIRRLIAGTERKFGLPAMPDSKASPAGEE